MTTKKKAAKAVAKRKKKDYTRLKQLGDDGRAGMVWGDKKAVFINRDKGLASDGTDKETVKKARAKMSPKAIAKKIAELRKKRAKAKSKK